MDEFVKCEFCSKSIKKENMVLTDGKCVLLCEDCVEDMREFLISELLTQKDLTLVSNMFYEYFDWDTKKADLELYSYIISKRVRMGGD